jgi:hypothetical protein
MQIGDSGACNRSRDQEEHTFENNFSSTAMNPIIGNIALRQLYLETLGPVATEAPIAFVT